MNNPFISKTICTLFMFFLGSVATLWAQNTPNDMSDFRDQDGKTFLFYVTGNNDDTCYGGEDNVYADNSPLAVAAVHAGLLKTNETKLIKVKVMAARANYPSITRNGITSEQYDSSEGSYQLMEPSPEDVADAPETMGEFIGKFGITFIFCVTGEKEGPIWGGKDNVYTTDSQIATAAVHAGMLKAGQKGIVRIKILPGQNSYPAVTRNGLTSHDYGEWEGSYQFVKEEKP